MKKVLTVFTILVILFTCSACAAGRQLHDGEYHAEFSDFDAYGYKDYIDVEISGGKVVTFEADALDTLGNKKSEAEEYRAAMEDASSTYPEKYYRDFANQYLFKGNADDIDIVAGATISTRNLIQLVRAVEQAAKKNLTEPIIVERNGE